MICDCYRTNQMPLIGLFSLDMNKSVKHDGKLTNTKNKQISQRRKPLETIDI